MFQGWMAAAAFVAVAGCGIAARVLRKRRQGADLADHALRLAFEITEIAETIDEDVAAVRDEPRFTRLAQRCRECAERARDTQAQRKALRNADPDALSTALLLLHDDHRRIVDLRMEADRALAARSQSREQEGSTLASRFASSILSSWSSTLSKARPSTP